MARLGKARHTRTTGWGRGIFAGRGGRRRRFDRGRWDEGVGRDDATAAPTGRAATGVERGGRAQKRLWFLVLSSQRSVTDMGAYLEIGWFEAVSQLGVKPCLLTSMDSQLV